MGMFRDIFSVYGIGHAFATFSIISVFARKAILSFRKYFILFSAFVIIISLFAVSAISLCKLKPVAVLCPIKYDK